MSDARLNFRFTFLSFDYSQIEMRILAHMSQDKYLLQFFKDEKDIHRLIASRCLGTCFGSHDFCRNTT